MIRFLSLVLCAFFLVSPLETHAARVFFEAPDAVRSGAVFPVEVWVDTEGEVLNAFEGTVLFPRDSLGLVRAEDGNSLVTVWLEHLEETETGIRFSGITPGGYTGKGLLFSLVLRAGEMGETLNFGDVRILKNDGLGTATFVETDSVTVPVRPDAVESIEEKDTVPPERFLPVLVRDPNSFEGKEFLVFATQDKGKGVRGYEACTWIFFGCRETQSPSVISGITSGIFVVRAYDFDGNSRTAFLFTDGAKITYGLATLALILLAGIVAFRMRRRHPHAT